MNFQFSYCRLSGLIVDVFGDLAVIASSAAWVEKYKTQVEACISRIGEIDHINWRQSVEMLKEEGLDLTDSKEVHLPTSHHRIKVGNLLTCLISLTKINSALQTPQLLIEIRYGWFCCFYNDNSLPFVWFFEILGKI